MKLIFAKKLWIALLVMVSLAVVSCGPAANRVEDAEEPAAETSSEEDTAVDGAADSEPAETTSGDGNSTITASGLEYIEIVAGDGPSPVPGDIVSVHYTGTLEDGTKFDSSVDRGEPIQFTLGQGEVIAGWDEGIALMQQGGKARLIIPSELGYGPNGSGPIPADATLIFDVELLEVKQSPKPTVIDEADFIVTDSGLKYHIFEEGSGDAPQPGDMVTLDFQLWADDGTFLQSTTDNGAPYTFVLGSDSSLPGLDEAIPLLNVGSKAQLVLPPELTDGSGASFIFEVELLEAKQPPTPTAVDDADYTVTDSGLKFYSIVDGSGDALKAGDTLSINYTLWLEDGTMIDSSTTRGVPLDVVLGQGGTIPGFEEGLLLMKEGGQAQIIVPPALGYGEAGGGPIPPNANLIFALEIVGVTPAAPAP